MNSSIKTRLERIEEAAKHRLGSGATITFMDGDGTVTGVTKIPGTESIVFIDDLDEIGAE